MRAYGCLTAAYIPAGEHRLELRYDPPGLKTGAVVTLSTLLLSLALLLLLRHNRKGKGGGGRGRGRAGTHFAPLPPDPGVSAFFPAYNDEATIGDQVRKAIQMLEGLTSDYEVIVINDGSTDSTAEVVRRIMQENDRVRLVEHEKNRGYGGALRSGFAAATRQLVFYTDGDGQYDVLELPSSSPSATGRTSSTGIRSSATTLLPHLAGGPLQHGGELPLPHPAGGYRLRLPPDAQGSTGLARTGIQRWHHLPGDGKKLQDQGIPSWSNPSITTPATPAGRASFGPGTSTRWAGNSCVCGGDDAQAEAAPAWLISSTSPGSIRR